MGRIIYLGKKKYRLVADLGYRAGTRLRKSKTVEAKNMTEAKKMLTIFEAELADNIGVHFGKYRHTNLNSFYTLWKKNFAETAYSPRTLNEYVQIIKNRILPVFGTFKVQDIKEIDTVHFFTDLQKDGKRLDKKKGALSSSSIHNIFKAFTSLMSIALEWKIIDANPCNAVRLPALEHEKGNPYDEGEVNKLLTALEDNAPEDNRLIVQIALVTGARVGEIAAIETSHLKTETNTIVIKQSISLKEGEIIVKSTKTKDLREVSVPAVLMARLSKQKLRQQTKLLALGKTRQWPDHQFLFSDEYGKPLRPDSIGQFWTRFCERNKLRHIRFHDLRHTSATLLINKGVHAKVIQERLGHSTIGTTMNVYGHVLRKADQAAAEHFTNLLADEES